ncbi:class I SAM-dependent methyltransferase [Aeromonas salmonicida]|uniref:class I SAM-dependent methyltransferase n=1 Tax=Aeromonas salmonicida TaxID=645 RepID=UPI0035A349A7
MSKSGEFIFKKNSNDQLLFVGDFDGYYRSENDPWGQSASSTMSRYYSLSRERLMALISKVDTKDHILEIGCGLGYVTAMIAENLKSSHVYGMDISEVAIENARHKFTNLTFIQADISDLTISNLPQSTYDIIVLNQLLWYILEPLPIVLSNIFLLLKDNGHLIISNAFAREQNYGVHIIDHFHGAAAYFSHLKNFKLLHAAFYNDGEEHDDGHFLLKKLLT